MKNMRVINFYQLNTGIQFLTDPNDQESIIDGINFSNNPYKQQEPQVPTLQVIKTKLQNLMNQHYSKDYYCYFFRINFHGLNPEVFGCEADRNYQILNIDGKKCELISYKTTRGNNCSFILLHKHFHHSNSSSCLLADKSSTQLDNLPVRPNTKRARNRR
jgi:hypothetical protein